MHFVIAIFSFSLLLYSFKKIFEELEFFNVLFHRAFRYFILSLTIPSIFYVAILHRSGNDFKKTESYSIKKFVEILDKKNFNKSLKIYDGTDGSFAFYSKIPTYHVKGMAGTPDYALKKKRMFNQFCDFRKNFLIDEKIDYVLLGEKITKGSSKEKLIKSESDFSTLQASEELVYTYYLLKQKNILKFQRNILKCMSV